MNKIRNIVLKHFLIVLVIVVIPLLGIYPFIPSKMNETGGLWIYVTVSSLLILILFYLNYYFLIPNYILKRRKVTYFFALALSVILMISLMRMLPVSFAIENNGYYSKMHSIRFLPFIILRITLTLILSWLMFFYEKWQEEKVEKQTSELKLLKSQYNPHFLFNALNSIYSKTLDVSDEASELVLKLSSILRYNLALDDTELITMEDEIIYINNYLDIQKVRLSHKVQIKLITHVEDDDTLIAPLFIVPLIENAFKYGVNNTDECFIFISIKQSKNILEVKIKNSKVIIDATLPASESFGLGLKNVKRRLDLYYPNRHDMTINETDDEYSVSLQLNMNK